MEKELPTLKLLWDADNQRVGLEFENKDFKTWDFVVGLLEMALDSAKFQQNLTRAQAMQAAQAQAQQAVQLRNRLKLG